MNEISVLLRQSKLPLWALLGLVLAVIAGCGDRQSLPPGVPASLKPVEVARPMKVQREYAVQWLGPRTVTVARGVHVLSGLYPSAAFAIETNQGVILIDTGLEEGVFELREGLMQAGLKLEDIRIVLVTHAHYDHVFGINRVREISGATVCAGLEDCEVLRSADQSALFSIFPQYQYSGLKIPIDRELVDGDVVELGTTRIEVIGTPGHTPGSLSFLLERDGQRIFFSGDAIASLKFGPATYSAHLAPRYRGDAVAFLETIQRLQAMEPPDLLLTSHPRQQTRMQSIRMDDETWQALLKPAAEELEQVILRHHQDGRDFLDGLAKEIEPGLAYFGDLEGVAVYGILDQDRLVVINAPGGSYFARFLDDALESLGWPQRPPQLILLTSGDEEGYSGLRSLLTPVHVIAPESAHSTLLQWSLAQSARARSQQARSQQDPAQQDPAQRDPSPPSPGIDLLPLESLADFISRQVEVLRTDEMHSYLMTFGEKQVAITPGVPRQVTLVWTDRQNGRKTLSELQPQTRELMEYMVSSDEFTQSCQTMLEALQRHSPDIWLPAIPNIGQNANLYDWDWSTVMEQNLRHLKTISVVVKDGL